MDKLECYRSAIKKILTEYSEMTQLQTCVFKDSEVSDRLAFNKIRDQYLQFRFIFQSRERDSIS